MAATFDDHIEKSRSEKVTLCHIEPTKRAAVFTDQSGGVYTRAESYFVVGVSIDGSGLSEASSSLVSNGEFFFEPTTNTLTLSTSTGDNPATHEVYITYRFFFSTKPLNLPYDLSAGEDVHYDGRLSSVSPLVFELDNEQIGISIESDSRIDLINTDGFFDEIFDRFFWEYKKVTFWQWATTLPMSEAQKVFTGFIEDKGFDQDKVTFNAKDLIYRLREPVSLGRFSESDGEVPDGLIGAPKRRIYGRVDQLICGRLDAVKSGFNLTGSVSGTVGNNTITGSGTSFLDECSPRDTLVIPLANDETFETEIQTVDSDTQITVGDTLENTFSSVTVFNQPDRPWRKKNRVFSIAGHKLSEPSTTVTTVNQLNRIEVDDPSGFNPEDRIEVGTETAIVRRVVNDVLVLRQNLQINPGAGATVTRFPVLKAYIGSKEAVIDRDWSITNSTEAKITFTNDAELNIASTISVSGSFTFTNGSRTVSVSGADAVNYLESRDWIRSTDINHTVFYEVLDVDESTITLRTPYAGVSDTTNAEIKRPQVIDDEIEITVNCYGLERSGVWIKTAAECVEDMVVNDAQISINSASVQEASNEAPYWMSLPIPESLGRDAPKIRDVISKINDSVFGSLYNNLDFELEYTVLSQEKPSTLTAIKSDDVLDIPRTKSNNNIVRKVNAKYRPFFDIFEKRGAFKFEEFTNSFVDRAIGSREEKDVTLYLYNQRDAETITQRYALFNSLSQSVMTIKAKLLFSKKKLNDKLWIETERLYKRFGSNVKKKIAVVSKIKKSTTNTEVEIQDLSNSFNRVMSIADTSALEFSSSSDNDKLFDGYIVDNDTELPDNTSEDEAGSNIIG